MKDLEVYEIAKMWLPVIDKGVIKIESYADEVGGVSLHFDDDYTLYITKTSLVNLKSLISESIDALDAFEKFKVFESDKQLINNVLEFRKRDDV